MGETRKSAGRKAGSRSPYGEDERHRLRRGRENLQSKLFVTDPHHSIIKDIILRYNIITTMLDMNKHVFKNDSSKPFHSSVFAEVANSDQLGSTSNISFSQRQQIETNRQLVDGYQRSAVGSAYGVLRAKPTDRIQSSHIRIPQRPTLQQHNIKTNSSSRHFSEPQARPYNPYS